ncbi:MAG: (2Fe-2S)-binding protein, partial [SAR324 cluster bacterium]|nr:(2Fe-2S)-binding protein [SAR324 cluster bacterium]
MEVETASKTIRFKLNGQACSIASNPVTRTSDVLREELGLTGTKVGCDAGDCGACTILIDGEQRFACLTAAGQLEGCDVQTVEGLAKDGKLSPLQQAFHRYGAAQCGICTPGMLMAAQSLLNVKPNPSREEVEDALGGVLCRCTGYSKIVAAVLEASGTETQELPADADSG